MRIVRVVCVKHYFSRPDANGCEVYINVMNHSLKYLAVESCAARRVGNDQIQRNGRQQRPILETRHPRIAFAFFGSHLSACLSPEMRGSLLRMVVG